MKYLCLNECVSVNVCVFVCLFERAIGELETVCGSVDMGWYG